MSLSDLVPVILATKLKPAPAGIAERRRRWQQKNREHIRAYKRAWDAKQRGKRV